MKQTREEIIANLRERREKECFSVVNRGLLWYNYLSTEQRIELSKWYDAWLDVTITLVVPAKPLWLKDKLEKEEII